jgi:hypothetical protein
MDSQNVIYFEVFKLILALLLNISSVYESVGKWQIIWPPTGGKLWVTSAKALHWSIDEHHNK